MEHELDFNDKEIDFITKKEYVKKIEKLYIKGEKILFSSYVASNKNINISVCFAGKTNVGKLSWPAFQRCFPKICVTQTHFFRVFSSIVQFQSIYFGPFRTTNENFKKIWGSRKI